MPHGFVHLHTHSYYSLLDAVASPEALVAEAAALGMSAMALTDHDGLFGVLQFYRAAKAAGIKPIIGLELGVGLAGHHVTLLAETKAGYRNLCRLASAARRDYTGIRGKPVDADLFHEHTDGLIVLSGCARGEIAGLVAAGRAEAAYDVARRWREKLGRERFFIELQHDGTDGSAAVNDALVQLAGALELDVVATHNVHYVGQEDAAAREALLALGAHTVLSDAARPRADNDELYLKSAAEMEQLFARWPAALRNTAAIAARCRVDLDTGRLRLPRWSEQSANGETFADGEAFADDEDATRLAQLVYDGARARFVADDEQLPRAVRDRLAHELHVISSKGLASYFLIVQDVVRWAREQGIPVGPGRGSAASSLVAYCLHITDVDPLTHGLLFERFLNPERATMPDIDIDVCDTRRDEVLDYVRRRHGEERVAQIVTFGTLAARAALRQMGRVLEVPADEVNAVVGLLPNEPGITLAGALRSTPALARRLRASEALTRLFALAEAVEGVPHHLSVHAAGIIIGDAPLADELPLMVTPEGHYVTQYAMDDVEALGFLKMDFLALRTLTVTQRARELVAKQGGHVPTVLPLDDERVYDAINERGTEGLFQLETAMFRNFVQRLQPRRFSDIVALLALGRPGPMQRVDTFVRRRHGKEAVRYAHPLLADPLADTFGVIVYQEQVMRVAMDVAGYSAAEADLLRRGMSAKDASLLRSEGEKFVAGALANGVDEAAAKAIFAELERFAGYGFAKSHSVAYALLTYETAYLRTHYPAAFLAALLTSLRGNTERIGRYVAAAKNFGVRVLPPDVNGSGVDFRVVDGAVVYGLEGLRNVGRPAAEAIVAARGDEPFASVADLCARLPGRHANRRLVESLIRSGACDALGGNRADLLAQLDATGLAAGGVQPAGGAQTSLFGVPEANEKAARPTVALHVAPAATSGFPRLRRVLAAHPGSVPVTLRVPVSPTDRRYVTIAVHESLRVTPGAALRRDLQRLVDEGVLVRFVHL